jgi:pSer/pThr/pTyr-binding forkhead associated (FHA) protein
MVQAFVLVQLPGGVVRKDVLGKPLLRVGRGRDCEIHVDNPRVSRLHALVDLRGGAWHVSDTKSTGGTFLNDRPVHDPVPLRTGDTIRLGRDPEHSVTMVFHLGS